MRYWLKWEELVEAPTTKAWGVPKRPNTWSVCFLTPVDFELNVSKHNLENYLPKHIRELGEVPQLTKAVNKSTRAFPMAYTYNKRVDIGTQL